MNTICFSALHNFEFHAPSVVVPLSKGFIITNDKERIRRTITKCPTISLSIGKMEYEYLLNGKPVAILEIDDDSPLEYKLMDFLFSLQMLSNALWVHCDSCIDTEMGFAFETDSNYKIASNMIRNGFTTSNGKKLSLKIGFKELCDIIKSKYSLFIRETKLALDSTSVLVKGTDRINRAFYHFTGARSINTLELKIANYCSGFEAMLSTSNAELSHQLAERISILLFGESAERISCYRNMKKIYDIRSRVVHGASVEIENLADFTVLADGIARALYERILTDTVFESLLERNNAKEIEEYFLEKLFS